MRLFLKRVLCFFILGLFFASIADLVISVRLRKTNLAEGEYSVWNDIYSGKMNIDLIILGSSRAWVHIDPEIFKENQNIDSYNLGVDGHNFIIQFLRFKEFISENRFPEYIILSLDVFTLEKKTELYNYQQFLPYMLWDRKIYEFTKSFTGFSKYDFVFPILRYFGSFPLVKKAFLAKDTFPLRVNGYRGQERSWNPDLKNAIEQKGNIKIEIDSTALSLFDQFLENSIASGFKLAFVYTPEYFKGQNFVSNRREVLQLYQFFSEKFNIPFLDYTEDEMSFQIENFYNASHLNKKGSEIFTNKLVKDLREIGFFENQF